MNRIGVVVVTYNSAGAIGRCLRSLPPGLDVAVVDNASADRTCEEVRQHAGVRLIANPWNRGFAAAANQGIGALETEYALLLNPDIEIVEGLDRLADDCDQTGAAAAGARLVGSDGRPQTGFFIRRFPTAAALAFEVLGLNRLWPGNRANRRYRCLDFDGNLPTDVEQPPGALLLIRRTAWRQLGGLDESFRPVWFEDVDFLKRASDAGYRIRYVPSAIAQHEGGHSVTRLPLAAREEYWYGNLLRYADKHLTRKGRLGVCWALILGSILRAAFELGRSGHFEGLRIYARVLRMAGVRLVSAGPGLRVFRLPTQGSTAA